MWFMSVLGGRQNARIKNFFSDSRRISQATISAVFALKIFPSDAYHGVSDSYNITPANSVLTVNSKVV